MPAQHTAAAPLHLANELFGQPSLADARLTQDYRGSAVSAQCSAERFTQHGELLLSVDQRRMTGRAEESRARYLSFRSRRGSNRARRDDGPAAGNDLAIDPPRFFGRLDTELSAQHVHTRLILA